MYSAINISGLAVGIAACLLITLYVQDEFAYDSFHSKSDRVYRVMRQMTIGGQTAQAVSSNYALQDLVVENIPQVQSAARIAPRRKSLMTNKELDLEFIEDRFFFGEETIFEVFDFEFISGNANTALKNPFSLVITEPMAEKYFKGDNPIGKVLILDNDKTFKVTGVIAPLPINSHFHFDFLASLKSTEGWYPPVMFEHWGNMWMYSYLLLKEGADYQEVERQMGPMLDTHGPAALKQFDVSVQLQPLRDIHLYSNYEGEIEQNSSITFVRVFMVVAFLVLLIACFNFINLATARSAWRAKEVGIRKVVGAAKKHLVFQFLGESVFISLIGTLIAIVLVLMVLPGFNEFSGKNLELNLLENTTVWLGLITVVALVGLTAGSFPAFLLSSFKPIMVLKGKNVGDQRSASLLRRVLVVFQFTISIVLIIGTVIVYQQLQFMKDKDLGFEGEQVLVVPLNSKSSKERVDILKAEFLSNANVEVVSAASDVPPSRLNSWRVLREGAPTDTEELIEIVAVDYDYLEVLDLELVDGRSLQKDFATDALEGILMNEAAVNHLGLNDPIGTKFDGMGIKNFNLIGVVKDFHFNSLHNQIEPLIIHIWPAWYDNLLVKVRTNELANTIEALEGQWNGNVSDWAFEYYFLDEEFGKLYAAEEKLGELVTYFSLLAILIASLGLFGLASFMAEQKIQEIGIRKVLGASIPSIVWLQFRVFLILVLISLVLAVPLGMYSMENWLQDFAYRVDIDWKVFLGAGIVAIVIAFMTVGYQTLKAALSNPVNSLRNE